MENFETIKLLTEENIQLKEKLFHMEEELNNIKNQINESKIKTKQYYENNKEKIIERVKKYNKLNDYKADVTSEKKKEYNRNAYLKKKEKGKMENQNI